VARAVLGLDLDAGAELDRLFDAAAAALAAHVDVALLEELALG
jgi:hypothetical protein